MSSSFRNPGSRSERLYTLSRRELQALCKQNGIPTNRSNGAMVDALYACVPVDSSRKPKAHSSRVFKATPSKGDGGAETPSGKRKLSPTEEGGSLKPSVTPLRRGMKRSERPPLQTPREENPSRDRFGKSVAATSSFRPTPGKRPGSIRRGGAAVQPVSCTEIEFRNAALHKELFGGPTEVTPMERGPHPSNIPVETGFEFRDLALHKDLFGPNPNSLTMVPSVFISPLTSSSPEVLDYSGHEIRVLSSIREEDAGDEQSGKKEVRDLGPLLGDSPAYSLSRMEDDLLFSTSPLVKEATTPLTKLRNNIGCTLTKATSILEKLAAMRVDAEKKRREGYWEPKFTSPVFQKALAVDRDLPSAKKARLTPKALSRSETEFVICEDAIVETPAKTNRSRDHLMSDKENQHWKSRKTGSLGKDQKKSKQHDVLKDRSKNVSDHVNNEPGIRPEEMSLRKLRAQFKEKIRQLEASKASDLRPWSERVAWNTSL